MLQSESLYMLEVKNLIFQIVFSSAAI